MKLQFADHQFELGGKYLTDELPDYSVAEAEDEAAEPGVQFTGQDTGSLEFDAPEQTWSEFFNSSLRGASLQR